MPPLSSAPVQLLNLSRGQLQRLASEQSLSPAAGATKIDLIRLLVEGLSPAALAAAADDYLYAGKTAASWMQFTQRPVSREDLKSAVLRLCRGDPFAASLRPRLDSTPKLIQAREWQGDKIVLTFAIRGNERLVFQGYQLREVSEDISFQAIFRLEDAVLEIRSSQLYVQRLRGWAEALATALGRTVSPLPVGQAEFAAIRGTLSASLTEYTGLDETTSPYRTRSVTNKPSCPDLAADGTFQQDFAAMGPVRGDIVFVGPEGEDVTVLVAVRTSSVYFRSTASEATIDSVYSALKGVWP